MFLYKAAAVCQHLPCNGTKQYVPMTWQRDTRQFQEGYGVSDLLGDIEPHNLSQTALPKAPLAAFRDRNPRLFRPGAAAEDAGTSKKELGSRGS